MSCFHVDVKIQNFLDGVDVDRNHIRNIFLFLYIPAPVLDCCWKCFFKLYAVITGSEGMHLEYYRNASGVFRSQTESQGEYSARSWILQLSDCITCWVMFFWGNVFCFSDELIWWSYLISLSNSLVPVAPPSLLVSCNTK